MRILIGTSYAPDTWHLYPAQKWFFDQTTAEPYRLVIASSQKPPFACEWVQSVPNPEQTTGCQKHCCNLQRLAKLFRRQRNSFDVGVICDSDVFPVRIGWVEILAGVLRPWRRMFAAPVRTENGDMFPHISFLFFTPERQELLFPHLKVEIGHGLFGRRTDPGALLPLAVCYPLLKSNRWSPSPTLHTIYGDLIYHRAAGSRQITQMGYRDFWTTLAPGLHDPACMDQPMTPAFINRLLGEQRFPEVEIPAISALATAPEGV